MSAKRSILKDLTFVHNSVKFPSLDAALHAAVTTSLFMVDGKNTTVLVYAHSVQGARQYGGDEAVAKYQSQSPDDPLASIHVRAKSSYWT